MSRMPQGYYIHRSMRNLLFVPLLALQLAAPALQAQQDSVPLALPASSPVSEEPPGRSRSVQWYHAAAVAGILAGASLLDRPIREDLQEGRSEKLNGLARATRRMGQVEVYATVGLGTVAAGLILDDPRVTRAGGRITASLTAAGLGSTLIKQMMGRSRPNRATGPYEFEPFSGDQAFPSGHTAMAFALATSVSDEIHEVWATIPLYLAATATGWSRMNDNKHWFSDVLGGALVGHAAAKLMNGRWRVFGFQQPRFLITPHGAPAIGWSIPLNKAPPRERAAR